MSNPYEHFRQTVQGTNFMTPEYVGSGWIEEGKISYEISKGRGIYDEIIYGLTISGEVGSATREWSGCHANLGQVNSRIAELRAECETED